MFYVFFSDLFYDVFNVFFNDLFDPLNSENSKNKSKT